VSKDIYELITARFIEQLKRGTVPWQKPWMRVQNIVSKKPYRGINALILGGSEFQSPYWLTFKQAHDLGGKVKKGEKATPVIYYKLFEKRDDHGNLVLGSNGRPTRIPFIRWSNAFNLEQTEGIEAPAQTAPKEVIQPIDKAAKIVQEAKICPIYHTGFAAVYSPGEDVIRMPAQKTFRSPESYYQTLFHEMTHSTGHASRLDREGVTLPIKFGSERYSKEELIAELGASFLSNEAGILNKVQFDNSAAYLGSWIEKFENDPKMIFTASSQAQRSTDFILGVEQKESVGESQSPAGLAAPKPEEVLAQKTLGQMPLRKGLHL
jgi:antirestriction protein ArdC